MFAKVLIIAGVTLVAVPAAAQQNTQCTTTFGITNCTTTGSPTSGGVNWGISDPNAYQRSYDRSKAAVDSITNAYRQSERDNAQREQLLAMQQQANQAQAQSQQVAGEQAQARALGVRAGQMVAAGNCAGAQKLALDAGDFVLANEIKGYCAK